MHTCTMHANSFMLKKDRLHFYCGMMNDIEKTLVHHMRAKYVHGIASRPNDDWDSKDISMPLNNK